MPLKKHFALAVKGLWCFDAGGAAAGLEM